MLEDQDSDLLSDGIAEIIKMCALLDSTLFNILKINNINSLRKNRELLNAIVKRNIKHKIDVITLDVRDSGFRNILNFGHTVGHAIESLEAFNTSHGKSVSIGLCTEVQLAIMMQKTPENVLFEIKDILENYNLPTEIPSYILSNIHDLIEKFKVDKKNDDKFIRFIYINSIGNIKKQSAYFLSLEKDFLLKFFSKRIYIDNEKKVQISKDKIEFPSDIDNKEQKIIKLKGSKSICNRALILAALAKGKVLLENFLFSEDTSVMIKCLKLLGISISILNEDSIIVEGYGTDSFKNKNVKLFVENAGTAARFLTGFCLLFKNSIITIDGIERMRERPIDDLLDSILDTQEYKNGTGDDFGMRYFNDLLSIDETILRDFAEKNYCFDYLNDRKTICFEKNKNENKILLRNNIEIIYLNQPKKMPFCIITSTSGFELKNNNKIKLKSKKSSQFVSSLLLISPFISVNYDSKDEQSVNKNLEIILTDLDENLNEVNSNSIKKYKKPVSYQYIDMTLKMMELWKVKVIYNSSVMDKYILEKFSIDSGIEKKDFFYVNPENYKIEPDASTANFYLSYIAINGGSIILDSIGKKSIQGDSKFIDFIKKIRTDFIECEIEDHCIKLAAEKLDYSNKKVIFHDDIEKEKCFNTIIFDEDISIITDSFLALGVVCSQIPGEYFLRGIENQAVKECNRLEVFCENLNNIGVFCSILNNGDGIYINSTNLFVRKNNLNFIEINTANDHRVAMAFAILAKFLKNTRLYIDNKNCVNKTYPEFWNDFNSLFGLKYSVDRFNINKSIYKIYKESYLNKPVFLVGMRSCGKTSFGRIAAKNLDLAFYDLDDMLMEKYKNEFNSIKDMVDKKGWDYFRNLERKLFIEIFEKSYKYCRSIIACGGGIVENSDILIALKKTGNVIFIDTPFENIEEYISLIDEIKLFQKAHLGVEDISKISKAIENRAAYTNNKDMKTIYKERLPKYKYVSKFIFKTPFINDLKSFIEMFTAFKNYQANEEDYQEYKILKHKILSGISNFQKTVNWIGDIFTQFVYTSCNPMKYPVPHDHSNFLCVQVDEGFLNKIKIVKKFLNNINLEQLNLLENSFDLNNLHNIIQNDLFCFYKTSYLSSENITEIQTFFKINFSQYNAVELRFDYFLQKLLVEKNNDFLYLVNNFNYKNQLNLTTDILSTEYIPDLLASIIQDFRFITFNKVPIIFTIRSVNQGGFFKLNLKEYNLLIKNMLKYGLEYIDLEFHQENIKFIDEFYQRTKEFNTSVILSNHFIEDSIKNDINYIKKTVYTMSLLNCDIQKIITNFDNFSLYKKEFLELKSIIDDTIKKPLIFFQLGDHDGKMTRFYNTYFLPVFNEKLALPTGKGQLSLDKINTIKKIMNEEIQKQIFDYKVIGTNVSFSPSPKIYEICLIDQTNKRKMNTDFDINFGFYNINYEDFKKKLNEANNENEKINNGIPYRSNLEIKENDKSFYESREFYNIISNNKLLFASITIPFKTKLVELLTRKDKINRTFNERYANKICYSEETVQMNSVNCIKKVNIDKIMCYNTDWIGSYEIIVDLLQKLNKDLSEIKLLVLGSGGAANAILFSLIQFNFCKENIFIFNRTQDKAIILAKNFNINIWSYQGIKDEKLIFDIIISTVPSDCDTKILESLTNNVNENTILVDLAYVKPGSDSITNFKKHLGIKSKNYIDGILFLLKQAYYSFEIFYAKICPRIILQENFLFIKNK